MMKKLLILSLLLGLASWTHAASPDDGNLNAYSGSSSLACIDDFPSCWNASCGDDPECRKGCKECQDGKCGSCGGKCKDCGKNCKDCQECKQCKDCKGCQGCKDGSCCEKCKDCKDCKGCKDPAVCRSSCQGGKAMNTYEWMTNYVVDSGEVFNKLQLSEKQRVTLKALLAKRSKTVLEGAGCVLKDCGECPIAALRTRKYKDNAAAGLCCAGEVVRLVDVPLHQEIKSLLTVTQYEKYRKAVALMGDYSKQARPLMNIGEKGSEKLSELYAAFQKKLEDVLRPPVRKTAKAVY